MTCGAGIWRSAGVRGRWTDCLGKHCIFQLPVKAHEDLKAESSLGRPMDRPLHSSPGEVLAHAS